jgi:acetylxylan esterase
MKSTLLSNFYLFLTLAAATHSSSSPAPYVCPLIQVFGARETTAPPGIGSAQTLLDLVTKAFPGTTSEAIGYPAAPGK